MSDPAHEIAALMRHILHIPVPVSDGDFRTQPPPLGVVSGPESVFHFLDSVFGWLPLNPSKPLLCEAIREVYVPVVSESSNHSLPTEAAFAQLYEDLIDDDVKCIYITGVKGCGKTAAMNYFLNEFHGRINIEGGMTWFRSDISKIYASLAQLDRASEITLYEYHQAHSLYVALRYSASDPLLRIFVISEEKPDNSTFYQEVLRKHDDVAVETMWREVVATFYAYEKAPLQFVHAVIQNVKRLAEGAFDRLIARMMKAIRTFAGSPGKRIIQILDGVDNIDKKKDEERYWRFLGQLSVYAGVQHKTHALYDKSVIVLRHETLLDLEKLDPAVRINQGAARTEEYRVVPIRPAEMLDRKCRVAQEPKSRFFIDRKAKSVAAKGYEPVWERALKSIADLYFDELGAAVGAELGARKAYADPTRGNDEEVLRTVFNDDIRTLSQNLLNTIRYIKMYFAARGAAPELAQVLQVVRTRRHLLLEGSVTGGQPYMPTHNQPDRTRWCPNLFYFDLTSETSEWMGLALLRVIQVLADENIVNVTEGLIEDRLSKQLHYDIEAIRSAIATAWAFGLIESYDVLRTAHGTADVIRVTQKGRFIMRAPFANPSITYFMAASARLHQTALEDSKCYTLHDPTRRGGRNFVPAAVKTGLTLLRHVITKHRKDIVVLGTGKDAEIYALPSIDEWIIRAAGYCSGLAKHNRTAYDSLLLDLKGIAA